MAKEFGYCSSGCTRPQFERQIDSINSNYPNAIIIKEIYSQTLDDRTELNKLLSQLESDDVLIVNSMDRLGSDPEDVFSYYMSLAQRGVKLIFIKQPFMDTEVYISALNDTASQTPASDRDVIAGSLSRLLKEQISRILKKSREDLQMRRPEMREHYKQSREEEKQNGPTKGKKYESRKSFMVKELIRKYNQNYDGSLNDIQTMEQIRNEMGTISRNTYYKYKKELAAE